MVFLLWSYDVLHGIFNSSLMEKNTKVFVVCFIIYDDRTEWTIFNSKLFFFFFSQRVNRDSSVSK